MYFFLPLLPPVPSAPPQNITLEVVLSRVSSTFLPWPTLYVSISPFVRVYFPPSSCLFPLLLFCYRLFSGRTASLSSRSLNPLTRGVSQPPPPSFACHAFPRGLENFLASGGDSFNAAKQIISLPFIRSASASQKNNPEDENDDCVYAKTTNNKPPPHPKKMKAKATKKKDWVLRWCSSILIITGLSIHVPCISKWFT